MSPGSGLFSTPPRGGSIVSAALFHGRVRDGNGWDQRADGHQDTVAGEGFEPPTFGL